MAVHFNMAIKKSKRCETLIFKKKQMERAEYIVGYFMK